MREKQARFFKTLPYRCYAVCKAIFVTLRILVWRQLAILFIDVPAGEDVRRGERTGFGDTVKEKDAVLGGYEEDAGAGAG